MISLTLLPSQSQAKLGPTHSIAGEPGFSTDSPSNKPAGGGLSFSFRGRKNAASNETKTISTSRVKVRLAEGAVLLPFHERPVEVKELLLHTDSKNKQLVQSLENLFHSSPLDWNVVQTLFFEIDRDELGDGEWLARLYDLVFPKSPSTWCRLADCLGAHALDWRSFGSIPRDEEEGEELDDDVFTDSGSSFLTERTHTRSCSGPSTSGFEMEALHEVPQSFRVPPIRARRPSSYLEHTDTQDDKPSHARQHRSLHHRRGSSLISMGEDQDIHDFLTSKVDGFAGIRLSLSGRDRHSWSPHQTQQQSHSQPHERTINAHSYAKEGAIDTTQIRQRGATVSGPHHDQHQQHKYTHHRRLSSLFTTPHDDHRNASQRKRSSPDLSGVKPLPAIVEPSKATSPINIEPSKRVSPASTFARSYSSPKVVKSDECKLGLLPDGRTRHPSASDGEGSASKEATALLAFKRELQLSGYKNGPTAKGSDQSTSSLSSVFSPSMSEDSFATTISAGTSPMTRKLSPEMSARQVSKQQQQATTSDASTKQPNALIFPTSTNSGRPRSKHLLDLMNRSENIDVITSLKDAIGQDCYQRLCESIVAKERIECPDQVLLEQIAKDCFDLIDYEKDSQDVIEAHLIDEKYDLRWDAFVKLCLVWNVDSAVIREAKRRGGPAVKLF